MSTKFHALHSYFRTSTDDEIELSFEQIETIIGQQLANSAYKFGAYWRSPETHAIAKSWAENGYDLATVDLKAKKISFRKQDSTGQKEKRGLPERTAKRRHVKDDIPTPCVGELQKYIRQWDALENYTMQESALNKLFFQTYPENTNIDDVLIKAATLNDFYSTSIFNIYQVAKHIVNLKIDERLRRGDASLVNDIARVTLGDLKSKYFFSFASKYCSHHKPEIFPIYDGYVDTILRHFRARDGFAEFSSEDLKDYVKFKRVMISFQSFYNLSNYSLKDIDRYIWLLGKDKRRKNYKSSK